MKRAVAGLGALALLGVAAWATVALATRYAASPARTPCTVLTPGDHQVGVVGVDGARRDVLLHVPRTGAYTPRPLVIALHGARETGPAFARGTGFSRLADREGFLVAYPAAAGPASLWTITGQQRAARPREIARLRRSLDGLEGVACVNRARVFVTGVSNGGGTTARLACELADRLAGAAQVAGAYKCRPSRPLPILAIHGTADQVMPYGGAPPNHGAEVATYLARWRRIDRCAGAAKRLTPAPGVDEVAWRRCAAATSVEQVRLDHRARGWPGGPPTTPATAAFSTTWRMWQFFRNLPDRPVAS